MTIITSPIAPDLRRQPAGPATLGALLEALRRLIGRKRRAAAERAALRKLALADEELLRDMGIDRGEVLRQLSGPRKGA